MQNKAQKGRFIIVGIINTCIDFGLLFILKSLGLPTLSSNLISTTTAFCFSFFANKQYTFRTSGADIRRELILFILVTLFGLWVLQTLAINSVTFILAPTSLPPKLTLFIAKLFATIISLLWNYVLYSRLVFQQPKHRKNI